MKIEYVNNVINIKFCNSFSLIIIDEKESKIYNGILDFETLILTIIIQFFI